MTDKPLGDGAFRPLSVVTIHDASMRAHSLSTSDLVRLFVQAEIAITNDPVFFNAPSTASFREAIETVRRELDYRIPRKERP